MKHYMLSLSLHGIIWSGYSIVNMLSTKDEMQYKMILLGIFVYFAYSLSFKILKRRKTAVITTFSTFLLYMLGKFLFDLALYRV
ncbi:hypothetical protein [Bacillus taeanensis]|uniref:Uncharacterized protein n=1 Tax=Bacillus taeanensis TaxID=273032 RepID=A0A366Y0S3_9BACI|nr:hypothetical protein [Bacillus taeanensis]RBW70013.1 hypothetical protein DS031_09185 [Bacillus taeanensis]